MLQVQLYMKNKNQKRVILHLETTFVANMNRLSHPHKESSKNNERQKFKKRGNLDYLI